MTDATRPREPVSCSDLHPGQEIPSLACCRQREQRRRSGARKFNYRLVTVVAARDKSHCSMASLAFLALRVERPFSNIPMS
jgi:hypothetical protein